MTMELLLKNEDMKSLSVNWPRKFLTRHSKIKQYIFHHYQVWEKEAKSLLHLGPEILGFKACLKSL